MTIRLTRGVLPAILLAASRAACNADDGATGPGDARTYNQVQRLGNPLVSEVFLAKRSHPQHAAIGPAEDVAMISAELRNFVLTVAGRSQNVANTLQAVLLPDMLIVDASKPTGTAGWLSWALANGWGGRKLTDDVVDAGLAALFGTLLETTGATPGLATDNVPNDNTFQSTFPYLANPN